MSRIVWCITNNTRCSTVHNNYFNKMIKQQLIHAFHMPGTPHPAGRHLHCLLSMWSSSGYSLSPSRGAELLTLLLKKSPSSLHRKLILATYINNLILLPFKIQNNKWFNKTWALHEQLYSTMMSELQLHLLADGCIAFRTQRLWHLSTRLNINLIAWLIHQVLTRDKRTISF